MAREQWLVDGPKIIDIEALRAIRGRLIDGSVTIVADDEQPPRIEVAEVRGRQLKIALVGDVLVLDHPQVLTGDPRATARELVGRPVAHITLRVPARVGVSLQTIGAEVLVAGVRSAVTAATLSGDVILDGARGAATLTTTTGELSVRAHEGAVTVRSVSGDAILAGRFDVASVSTISGEAILAVESCHPDRITITTVSGDATVCLPEDARPRYVLRQLSGHTVLNGTTLEPRLARELPATNTAPEDQIDVRVRTVSGEIRLLRRPSGGDAGSPSARPLEANENARRAAETVSVTHDLRPESASESMTATGAMPL